VAFVAVVNKATATSHSGELLGSDPGPKSHATGGTGQQDEGVETRLRTIIIIEYLRLAARRGRLAMW
jgi:hypothetical protein